MLCTASFDIFRDGSNTDDHHPDDHHEPDDHRRNGAIPDARSVILRAAICSPSADSVPSTAISLAVPASATSAANPEMSGSVWIPPVPFMTATEVNGYSIVPLTFKIFGIPVYDTDGVPVYAGHTVPA